MPVSTPPNELRTSREKLSYFDLESLRTVGLRGLEAQESYDSFRIRNIGYF